MKLEEYKPRYVDKLMWKINDLKFSIENLIVKLALRVIKWTVRGSNYRKHAMREFALQGWPGDDEMQDLICNNVLDLLAVFATQGHSGSSAPYASGMFSDLSAFKIISPLTGIESEWRDTFSGDGEQQNIRASHVFRRADGTAYDSNGKVFRETNGCCYTNSNSFINIEFPYTPKIEYIDV